MVGGDRGGTECNGESCGGYSRLEVGLISR